MALPPSKATQATRQTMQAGPGYTVAAAISTIATLYLVEPEHAAIVAPAATVIIGAVLDFLRGYFGPEERRRR